MKLDERIQKRLASLIDKGEHVLKTKKPPPPGVIRSSTVDTRRYAEWRSQALAMLTQVFGSAHTYTASFEAEVEHRPRPYYTETGLGILRAALDDVEHGDLETLQEMAAAEVFSDFLDQADHLLENGYSAPAASLAGAVLENGLRSLAKRKGVTVKARDNLQSLNNKIAEKGIYNRLRQKQVSSWIEVRNAAVHGRFDGFDYKDVASLIKGVRNLLSSVT